MYVSGMKNIFRFVKDRLLNLILYFLNIFVIFKVV